MKRHVTMTPYSNRRHGFGVLFAALMTLLLLGWTAAPGRAAPPHAASPKMVFAHYMVCLPPAGTAPTVQDFKNDIVLAQKCGIDGFALNCGGWSTGQGAYYKRWSLLMYQAAEELGTNFQLFFSEDHLPDAEILDMVQSTYTHPNQFRCGGRPVLSSFDDPLSPALIAALAGRGTPVFFAPNYTPQVPHEVDTAADVSEVAGRAEYMDGFFDFGAGGTGPEIAGNTSRLAPAFAALGKTFMSSVTPYYRGLGGNYRLFETRGCEAMEAEWQAAISADVPWVEIVTWNDFSEASYLMPFPVSQEAAVWPGHWGPILSHAGYAAATGYYASWFKSGHAPAITQDLLCYSYRLYPKRLSAQVTPSDPNSPLARPSGADGLDDKVYVTLFAKQAGQLTIRSGSSARLYRIKAGVNNIEMFFNPGAQRFVFTRGAATVIDRVGEHAISATDVSSDFNTFSGYATGA